MALCTQHSIFSENIANWKLFPGKIFGLRFLQNFHAFGEVKKIYFFFSKILKFSKVGHFDSGKLSKAKEVSKFNSDTGFGEISMRAFWICAQNIFIYLETKLMEF